MTPTLMLSPCSFAEAKHAVETWHYSRSMPAGIRLRLGVYVSGEFVGAIIFGTGANYNIGKPYGLTQSQACELVRVALKPGHPMHVTRVVAVALRLLKKAYPQTRLVVSYADPMQGHVGVIYQAGNWTYSGPTKYKCAGNLCLDGTVRHRRMAFGIYGPNHGLPYVRGIPKHKYLYPLDAAMSAAVAPLSLPYPRLIAS